MRSLSAARRSSAPPARRLAVVASLLLALTLTACFAPVPPDTDPTIRGVIVDVGPGPEGGSIRVVWHDSLGEPFDLDALDAGIDEETRIFNREGVLIEFTDLTVRDVVDVWVSGAIAESYPPQGSADDVRVIGTFDDIRPLPVPPGLVEP